jgi:hypothetical protein
MNVKIYLNRDNVLTFGMLEDSAPVDARNFTRVILQFKPASGGAVVSIDSNTVPALFDWTDTQEFSGLITGVLKLMLGAMAGVAVGKYRMTIVAYDAVNTDGITWAKVNAQVIDDAT